MGIRKDVMYECKTCGVALCIDPCFEIYHTKKYYAQQDVETDDSDW